MWHHHPWAGHGAGVLHQGGPTHGTAGISLHQGVSPKLSRRMLVLVNDPHNPLSSPAWLSAEAGQRQTVV